MRSRRRRSISSARRWSLEPPAPAVASRGTDALNTAEHRDKGGAGGAELAALERMARAFWESGPHGAAVTTDLPARKHRGSPRAAMIAVGADGLVRSFDKEAERLFGFAASDVIGRPLGQLLDGLDLDTATGEVDVGGERVRVYAITDSRAAKTAGAEWREAQARYWSLIEQIPAVTFMGSLVGDDIELYVSPQIESLLGFSQEKWLSDPVLWFRQLHPEDRDHCNAEFARGCESGGPFRAEFRAVTRSGELVWIRGEARLVRDAAGIPVFLQGIAYDITESKRAAQKFRGLLEAAPDAMVMVDERGKIVLVNSQTERMFGYDRNELLGQPVELLIPSRFRRIDDGDRERYTAAPKPCGMGIGSELYGQDGVMWRFSVSNNGIGIEPKVLRAHHRALPTTAHARGVSGHRHRARDLQEDRRAPRRQDLGGIGWSVRPRSTSRYRPWLRDAWLVRSRTCTLIAP